MGDRIPQVVAGRPWVPRHVRGRDRRGSAARRGYGRRWRALRAAVLAAAPLCARCAARGLLRPADVGHHRIPIASARDPMLLDSANIEPLCRACHEREHGRLQGEDDEPARPETETA